MASSGKRSYEIQLWADGPYDDVAVTYGPDGTVIDMSGGAKGSQAAAWETTHG
ncbi:hypothetical protein ACIG47_17870 [Promicromonospora sp. NPDC052451]|uniref:hypothetical protein n=1 Tax=unclassified Promicromonospora TaxID=2647929 RepID=UPI0037C95CAC